MNLLAHVHCHSQAHAFKITDQGRGQRGGRVALAGIPFRLCEHQPLCHSPPALIPLSSTTTATPPPHSELLDDPVYLPSTFIELYGLVILLP